MDNPRIVVEATALIHVHKTPAQAEKVLRSELSALGIDWKTLKPVLPDWAEDAFQSTSGYIELKTFLSRNAGLDILDDGTLASRTLPSACFKTTSGTTKEQVVAARGIATACARLVSKATLTKWTDIPKKASALRNSILPSAPNDWIDFSVLLRSCWEMGIPVLYLPKLPISGKKMEGMVTFVGGRPVVILTKKAQHPDWLLFTLAHELGHIAAGHLPLIEGEAVVDEQIDEANAANDAQEGEANKYATHVLGPDGLEGVIRPPLPKAPELARRALTFARKNGMSPGYVVLNAVNNSPINGQKPFALAQNALKLLPDYMNGKDAATLCRNALRAHLDTDRLRDDSAEFLEKLELL
jgi:hypothetical protein